MSNTPLNDDVTSAIIGCAFEVAAELGSGFLESVYHNALMIALQQRGVHAVKQHPIGVSFRGAHVGEFIADLLVANRVIVELKAVKTLAPEHQAQVINYLKVTGIEVGLLINFGSPRLEYKRLTRTRTGPLTPSPGDPPPPG